MTSSRPATQPPPHPADRTARRLGRAITAQLAIMATVMTLAPLRFASAPVHGLSFVWTLEDIVLNTVFFLPFGFIPTLTRARGTPVPWRRVALIGFGLSLGIETTQLFTPMRYPSLFDLASNTTGALLGAYFAERLAPRVNGVQALRGLALEYPLMGIIHLLVPVLWLIGLGSAGPQRAWLVLPIVAVAGVVGGTVFAAERRTETAPRLRSLAVAGAAWLVVGLVPGSVREWRLIGGAAVVFIASAWLGRVMQRRHAVAERRFERVALRRVMPIALAYLVVSALHPITFELVPLHGTLALFDSASRLSTLEIFRAMERIAAFATVGYAIGEYRGRREEPWASLWPRVVLIAAGLACTLELARGVHPIHYASASLVGLSVLAALFGGWIYRLQIDHVRAITGRS